MSDTEMQFIHINVDLTLSEGDSYWHDPKVQDRFNFSIPVALLDVKKLAEMLDAQVKTMPQRLLVAKAKFEAEEEAKAKAAAEKEGS